MILLLPNTAPQDVSTALAILEAVKDPAKAKAMLQRLADEEGKLQATLVKAQKAEEAAASKEKQFSIRQAELDERETRVQAREDAVARREAAFEAAKKFVADTVTMAEAAA